MAATLTQQNSFSIITHSKTVFLLLAASPLAAKNSHVTTKWQAKIPMAGQSSLRATDLNKDGVKDLLIGTGILSPKGRHCSIQARDGKTGKEIWKRRLPGDGFATPTLLDITMDKIPDVFMGGRFSSFKAINGKDGKVIWDLRRANLNMRWPSMNFNTAVLIADEDGDKLQDLLLVQGGSNPDGKVIPSRIYKVSSKSGKILKAIKSPDKKEIYSVPTLIPEASKVDLLIGTGGETLGGNLLGMNQKSLKTHWRWNSGSKGIIGSPLVYFDEAAKKHRALVMSFGGIAAAIDVDQGKELWKQANPGYESYASPALLRCSPKDTRVVIHASKGVYPVYKEAKWMMLDINSGQTVFEGKLGSFAVASPLIVDWDQDGCEDALFVSNVDNGFGPNISSSVWVISGKTGKELYTHNLKGFAAATPVLTDLDGDDSLELGLTHWDHAKVLSTPLKGKSSGPWQQFRGHQFNGWYGKLK